MNDVIEVKGHFVASLDILEYGSKIGKYSPQELREFLEKVNKLIDVTKHTLQTINSNVINSNFDVKIKMFSDNIFLYTESNWFNLLIAVCFLQVNFVLSNIFIRGALSYGDLYANDDYISGKGLVQSYELENKIAIFPRVIISAEFLEATKQLSNVSIFNKNESRSTGDIHVLNHEDFEDIKSFFYEEDFDGWTYVSYLDFWQYYIKQSGETEDVYPIKDILKYHKENVSSNLSSSEQNKTVLQKYRWSKKYHNEFCKKHCFGDFELY